MATFTEKDIEFLSNQKLVEILQSLLDELDVVASSGAHRSTTYLAVSAIEGLFREILKLLRIESGTVPSAWPKNRDGHYKRLDELTLNDKEKILEAAGALPKDFEKLYESARGFRNYVHPDRELKKQEPIARSVGQLALACLNAVIEKYADKRFAAMQVWERKYGVANVPEEKVIHMPQTIGDDTSFLASELSADKFKPQFPEV